MSVKDGGPAFPGIPEGWNVDGTVRAYGGMSLRDYFAIHFAHAELVTAGMEQDAAIVLAEAADEAGQTIEERIAFNGYKLADAMLAERNKP